MINEEKYILLSNLVFGYSEWAKNIQQLHEQEPQDDPASYFNGEGRKILDELFPEAYAEQQRGCGRWVRASKIFPNDPNEKCFRLKIGSIYKYIQTEDFFDEYLVFQGEEIPYHKLEWLDESPCECQQLREALKKISNGHPDGNPQNLIDIATAAIADAGNKDETKK